MAIKLYRDNRKSKKGTFQIRVSVYFLGKRFVTSFASMTEGEFEQLYADYNRTQPKIKSAKHPLHKDFLRDLDNLNDEVCWAVSKVKRGELKPEDFDFCALLNKVKGKVRKSAKTAIFVNDLWHRFVIYNKESKDMTESTIRALNCFYKKLSKYAENIPIEELATRQGVEAFVEWNSKRGINNTTVKTQYAYFLWFLNWCFQEGYCSNDYQRFRLNLKSTDTRERTIIFLTLDEVERVRSLELTGNIELVRDKFLFQCYTGLRHSDMANLKKSDIIGDRMRLVVQKTEVVLDNRLNNRALEIANKYLPIQTAGDTLFPWLNPNSTELYLKEIGRMAGLDEPIRKVEYRNHMRQEKVAPKWQFLTTHVGRKTFIVNSLDMGLTATQVRSYSGHSSIQAMEPYISISTKKKDSAMDVWNTYTTESNKET